METTFIKRMIDEWQLEFNSIRNNLIEMGDKANTLEYNLQSADALRLSMCINDATNLVLEITEKRSQGNEGQNKSSD